MTENTADAKSRLMKAWGTVTTSSLVTRLTTPDHLPPGIAVWAVGDGDARSIVVLPELDHNAPFELQQRYFLRIIATAGGHCPSCDRVAGLDGVDPEQNRAMFERHPLTIRVTHAPGCPADFGPDDQQWFPLFGEARA